MGLAGAKVFETPMEQNLKLTLIKLDAYNKGTSSDDILLENPKEYRRLIGRLLYLTIIRPNIFFVVQALSQFMSKPKTSHMDAAIRVLKYLKNAPDFGILLSSQSSFRLKAYCDSDWATCPMSRKFITGYCIKLGDSLLSWKTKKQSAVSRSSAEAEYRSMATTTCEIVWIVGILKDMGVKIKTPVILHCDNKAVMQIVNPLFHERTKHIEIDCHLVREKILEKLIKTIYFYY
ncbi:secreted RxLR effector protein 161-like [Henckelia pumila]|uniref:secreted RxLR effector protein 161-like n=1 Tax=Henckelia pumila TaxID=405737 RepID=UPI003C6DE2A9